MLTNFNPRQYEVKIQSNLQEGRFSMVFELLLDHLKTVIQSDDVNVFIKQPENPVPVSGLQGVYFTELYLDMFDNHTLERFAKPKFVVVCRELRSLLNVYIHQSPRLVQPARIGQLKSQGYIVRYLQPSHQYQVGDAVILTSKGLFRF